MLKRLRPLVVVAALVFTLGFSQRVFADPVETTTALADAVIAAVASISDGVGAPGAPQSTIDTYSLAISLLLGNDDSVRLISNRSLGLLLGRNNSKPRGNVEKSLLADALSSGTPQSAVSGNTLITVIPLSDNFHPNCVTCHTDFVPDGTLIGAASFRVPMN